MRFAEALQIAQRQPDHEGPSTSVQIVCGFMAVPFEVFLTAHGRVRLGHNRMRAAAVGVYGDLEGNLQVARREPAAAAVVCIEWSDLDPRLSLRGSAGWTRSIVDDISRELPLKCAHIAAAVRQLATDRTTAVVPPTLPLIPITHHHPVHAAPALLEWREHLARLLAAISRVDRVRILEVEELARVSAPADRRDARQELQVGFPYTLAHVDAVAANVATLLWPPASRKGLITDLDGTFWRGVLGDDGTDGVSWSMESDSQIHALYQQCLASLAESGTLIAVASKNDPEDVTEALGRTDTLVPSSSIFPVVAGWGAKSEMVRSIVSAWNIDADSVVFVDDSPMELGEVSEHFPGIECLLFKPDHPASVLSLLWELRRLFGKSAISEEDALRATSIRRQAEHTVDAATGRPAPEFLARLSAEVTATFEPAPAPSRAFELVNKCNQHNLNGRRYDEVAWNAYLSQPGAFLLTLAYRDRFGPLGRIAAVMGRRSDSELVVDTWVMSCRAFSRQIEFRTLRLLFDWCGLDRLRLAYRATPRNHGVREILEQLTQTLVESGDIVLTSRTFEQQCPPLYDRPTIVTHG